MAKNLKKSKQTQKRKKAITGLLFVSPWIIGFLIFFAYPLLQAIYMSFNSVFASARGFNFQMVGFENYYRILREDVDFLVQAQNFTVSTLINVPVIISISIVIATLLNQKLKATSLFRLIYFIPIIVLNAEIMEILTSNGATQVHSRGFLLMLISMYAPEQVGELLIELFIRIQEILWYSGVPILIFLAALQKCDKSIYEAASIDGASRWESFWKITLPTIFPMITVAIIYLVVFLSNFGMNEINDIILGARARTDRGYGYASALSVLYTILQLGIMGTLLLVIRSRDQRRA
jgi:ABC-type sugar transport system permease subunit